LFLGKSLNYFFVSIKEENSQEQLKDNKIYNQIINMKISSSVEVLIIEFAILELPRVSFFEFFFEKFKKIKKRNEVFDKYTTKKMEN